LRFILPQRAAVPNISKKLSKLCSAMQARTGVDFYKDLCSHCKDPKVLLPGLHQDDYKDAGAQGLPALAGLREIMMYLDMMTYLPGDILTKVDRASMAVSLEARVPLLDHRVVEFAWRVPTAYKYRDGKGKWILRQVLYRYLPKKLVERPKMGFNIPLDQWLRGPLRDWAEELIDKKHLREEGFFDPVPIHKMWNEHVSGKRSWHKELWDVLMFQAWLKGVRK